MVDYRLVQTHRLDCLPPWNAEGGLEAFQAVVDIRCNGDVDKSVSILSAFVSMHAKAGDVFSRSNMAKFAEDGDLSAFWMWAGTDPSAVLLRDVITVPLLAVNGASCCVERMHKQCKIAKGRYNNRRSDKNVLKMLQMQAVWHADAKPEGGACHLDSVNKSWRAARTAMTRKRKEVDHVRSVMSHAIASGSVSATPGDVMRPELVKDIVKKAEELWRHDQDQKDDLYLIIGACERECDSDEPVGSESDDDEEGGEAELSSGAEEDFHDLGE